MENKETSEKSAESEMSIIDLCTMTWKENPYIISIVLKK